MALLISTQMHKAEEFKRILPFLEHFKGQVGVEIFPLFHEKGYERGLAECLLELKKVPVSFHGPYYKAEHSLPVTSDGYDYTMHLFQKTLEFCRKLNSRYLVFHHNNCPVTDKEKMIQISCENFRRAEELAKAYGIPVVVENAGVMERQNMLFNEEEFINLCRKEQYRVLIDIGHAHANGWNLLRVMEELKDQIAAYHLHNNDGVHDSHMRIQDGTLDFEAFLAASQKLTKDADWVLEYSRNIASDEEGILEDIKRLLEA